MITDHTFSHDKINNPIYNYNMTYTLIGASCLRQYADTCWKGDDTNYYIVSNAMSFNNKREANNARAIIEQDTYADPSRRFVVYYEVIENFLTSLYSNGYSAMSGSDLGAIMMGLPIIGLVAHDFLEGISHQL